MRAAPGLHVRPGASTLLTPLKVRAQTGRDRAGSHTILVRLDLCKPDTRADSSF